MSLTNCWEKRAVTVAGAKGSELSRKSYWADRHNSAPLPHDKIHWKGSKAAEVRNKTMEHLQTCQYEARGWCKWLSSSMESAKKPARTSVVWLPSKGRMTNMDLSCWLIFHWISQHQALAWKAPNVTPGNVYFIRSELKGRSSFFYFSAQSSHKSSIRLSWTLTFLSSLIPDGWML